ncbi:MAG: ferredoxin [Maritimibacter sp.]
MSGAFKVIVDWDKCGSLGQCEFEAPEVFQINDAGKLEVADAPAPSQRNAVEEAVRRCPTGAISIIDEGA